MESSALVKVLNQVSTLGDKEIKENAPVKVGGILADFQRNGNNEVYNTLSELNKVVDNLTPTNNTDLLNPSWWRKLFGFNGVAKYVEKFQSSQSVIDNLTNSLEKSRVGLLNDNTALGAQIEYLEGQTAQFRHFMAEAEKIRKELETAKTEADSQEKRNEIDNIALFPCLQKITDFQQRIAVNEQAVLAIQTIIKNNAELAGSVNRAKDVTVNALGVSIMIVQSLNQQKKVIDSVNTVNKQTSDLIKFTANTLKTQGVEIQKQASSAMLDSQSLEAAFNDCLSAFNDIKNFRVEAVKKLESEINTFNGLLSNIDKAQGIFEAEITETKMLEKR